MVAAFARDVARRYRWGWVALGAYVLWYATLRGIALATGSLPYSGWGAGFAFAVLVPGTFAFYWMVAVFTYGGDGNLAARESIFPARLFTLPVRNDLLAAWPMCAGAVGVGLLWVVARTLAPWPHQLDHAVPYVWPGLLAMVLLAWMQPLLWSSYPFAGLRVAAAVLWLGAIEVAWVFAFDRRVSEPVMIALLLPQFPLAYLAARRAVSRARHGEVAAWGGALRRRRTPASAAKPFSGAHDAQGWLEWNRYGRSLPALVAMVLPVELALLWFARDSHTLAVEFVVMAVLTPPFLATFTAVASRRAGDAGGYGLGTFIGTKPLSSAALIGARLRMAARSTMVTWLIVLVATPLALAWSGTWRFVAYDAARVGDIMGTPRAVVGAALVLMVLLLTTWRQMVQSLYLGLTGRPALVKGTAVAALCLLVALGFGIDWAVDSGALAWFWVALYWTLGLINAARMSVGSWIAARLLRDGLVAERTLVTSALVWLTAVAAIYGVLLWEFDSPHLPRFLLLLLATLVVPLVRLSAAPLALAWNRHR